MSRFNEKYLHSVDQKGRLSLSRELRARCEISKGDTIHLMPNLSDSPFLEMRTDAQWAEYERTIMGQDASDKKRNFMRLVDLVKETVRVDSQGRIVLPHRVREMCGLGDTVGVINMGSYVEVWNRDRVEEKFSEMVKDFRSLNEFLF